MSVLDDIRFWQQVTADAHQTVLCSPEMESRCKGFVDARGLSGMITVMASRAVKDDTLFVIDTPALDASINQAWQRATKRMRFNPMTGDTPAAHQRAEAAARKLIARVDAGLMTLDQASLVFRAAYGRRLRADSPDPCPVFRDHNHGRSQCDVGPAGHEGKHSGHCESCWEDDDPCRLEW